MPSRRSHYYPFFSSFPGKALQASSPEEDEHTTPLPGHFVSFSLIGSVDRMQTRTPEQFVKEHRTSIYIVRLCGNESSGRPERETADRAVYRTRRCQAALEEDEFMHGEWGECAMRLLTQKERHLT